MKTNVRLFVGSELVGEYHHVDSSEMVKEKGELTFVDGVTGKAIQFHTTNGTIIIEEE